MGSPMEFDMHPLSFFVFDALLIGIVATAVMDIWGWLRPAVFGTSPNYDMVGRWLLHMRHGQFRHIAISSSPAQKGERITGWLAHYLTGIAYAMLLLAFAGTAWASQPTLGPALTIGLVTVAAPFLLMQPGMGMGVAAANAPHPNRARMQSVTTHLVFGLGLYLGGLLLNVTVQW